MNDFSRLEAELKELRPTAPNPELIARIERSLGEFAAPTAGILPRPKVGMNWRTIGFGLAAAAAIVFLARSNLVERGPAKQPALAAHTPAAIPAPTSSVRDFVPDGLTSVLYNRSDEGLVFSGNSAAPVRRVRSRSRETLQWKDAGSGAFLRVSYPTEEVELIPISVQ